MNNNWPVQSDTISSMAKSAHDIFARGFRLFLFIAFLVGATLHSEASHLMGGEVVYEYLDDTGPGANIYRYRVTYTLYIWCGTGSNFPTAPPSSISFGAYYTLNNTLFNNYTVALTSSNNIAPNLPSGCNVPGISNLCIFYAKHETIVNLPQDFTGFTILI